MNGQRETANAFLVNGGDVSESRNLGTAVIPNLDSIAEFRLITNSFDAEYGKFSGAIMNAVTKAGTNGFHGTAFEFLRNDKLDARNFFDQTRGTLKRNQFGYAVGGPALKNRLFWFTDYQGTRETRGLSSGLVTLPSADQRDGVFTPARFHRPGRQSDGGERILLGERSFEASRLYRERERTVQPAELRQHGELRVSRAVSSRQTLSQQPAKGTLKFIPSAECGHQQIRNVRAESKSGGRQGRSAGRLPYPADRETGSCTTCSTTRR